MFGKIFWKNRKVDARGNKKVNRFAKFYAGFLGISFQRSYL